MVALGQPPRLESRIDSRAGQIDPTHLFACGTGVHVDFHANRHFDNLRSFPNHFRPPIRRVLRAVGN